jgi:hypothetical protein
MLAASVVVAILSTAMLPLALVWLLDRWNID